MKEFYHQMCIVPNYSCVANAGVFLVLWCYNSKSIWVLARLDNMTLGHDMILDCVNGEQSVRQGSKANASQIGISDRSLHLIRNINNPVHPHPWQRIPPAYSELA